MALTKQDKADIASMVAEAVAGALVAIAGTKAARTTAKAAGPVTFHTKAEVAAGAGFPCSAPEPCSRTLSTTKRASIHGVDAGGHIAR